MESAPKTLGMVVADQKLRPLSCSHLAPGLGWILRAMRCKGHVDIAHCDSVPRSEACEAAGTSENSMHEPELVVLCDVCLLLMWQT